MSNAEEHAVHQLEPKYTHSTLHLYFQISLSSTYDHRHQRTGHPVRSAIHKLVIGRLVVGSVTTSEFLLLYVF